MTANADLRAVEAWLDTTVGSANGGETSAAPPGSSASQDVHSNLETLLKRLRQELRGQIDAEKLEKAREAEELGALAAEDIERAVRRPYAEVQPDSLLSLSNRSPRPSAPYTRSDTRDEAEKRPSDAGSTESAPPRSLPALLHTLASLSGNLFAGNVSRVSGDRALISDLGSGPERPGAKKVRARVVTAADASSWLCEVSVHDQYRESPAASVCAAPVAYSSFRKQSISRGYRSERRPSLWLRKQRTHISRVLMTARPRFKRWSSKAMIRS